MRKTTRNEENGEEQVDGVTNDGNGTTEAQHDNVQVEEVATTKIVQNTTIDNLEEQLEATELDEDDANLQCEVVNETVTKVKKPCACGSLTHSRRSHHDCPLRQKKRKFKPRVVRPIVGGKGLKSMKEPRFLTHKNLLGIVVDDDDKDSSPPPDVPPIHVTTAEGDNLESEEAINRIKEQNTPNDNEEDQQYNKPRFIDVGGGGNIPYIPVIDVHSRNFKASETEFKMFGNKVNSGYGEVAPTPEALGGSLFR